MEGLIREFAAFDQFPVVTYEQLLAFCGSARLMLTELDAERAKETK